MLRLDLINNQLRTGSQAFLGLAEPLQILRTGQNNQNIPLPYIEYSFVTEARKANYQVSTVYQDPTITGGTLEACMSYTSTTDYQYALVAENNSLPSAIVNFEGVYDYTLTEEFSIALRSLVDGPDTFSYEVTQLAENGVQEIRLEKDQFFERRFIFELRFYWLTNRIFDASSIGEIDTIDIENLNTNEIIQVVRP